MKRLFLLLTFGFAAGCATVRHAREAQDEKKIPAGERTVTAAEAGLSTNTVLTLPRAINVALRFHPAIVEARENLAVAEAQARETKAGLLPQIGGNAAFRRATSKSQGATSGGSPANSYSAGLTANLLLYDFGKTPALVHAALSRLVAAENDLLAAQNTVSFNVRTAFFTLSENIALLQVAEENVRQNEVHLDQSKTLFEVGKRIRYDITTAEVNLGNAKLALINAQNAVTTSRATLNRALGLAEEPGYQLGESPQAEFDANLNALMQTARNQKPELRSLQAQVLATSANVDAAIANLYPSFNLTGGLTGGGSHFPLVWNWSAAAQSAATLFDGGIKSGQIMEAVAQLRAARARQADEEQQIYLALSQAVASLDGAKQRLQLTELIVRQAAQSLDLVNERFRLGLATTVDVTDAQASVATAKSQQVQAHFDVLNNIAAIKHTIGEP